MVYLYVYDSDKGNDNAARVFDAETDEAAIEKATKKGADWRGAEKVFALGIRKASSLAKAEMKDKKKFLNLDLMCELDSETTIWRFF